MCRISRSETVFNRDLPNGAAFPFTGIGSDGFSGLGAGGQLRARTAAYTGFRAPTLNELYRPFRVGNDITEANAALKPERLFGAEFGLDWEPVKRFSFTVIAFSNQLRDAVGNVTIGEGTGTFEPGGFVPAGGVLRQRRNLDRAEVPGLEAKLLWKIRTDLRLRGQYLLTNPTVTRALQSPSLEGKLLAQAPEQVAVAGLEWTPGRWQSAAQVRYVGRQFEDDLNTLPLAHSRPSTCRLAMLSTSTSPLRLRPKTFSMRRPKLEKPAGGWSVSVRPGSFR